MRIILTVVFVILACLATQAESTALHKLNRAEQVERVRNDLKMVAIYRAGLSNSVGFAAGQTNLFPATETGTTQLPRREEKEILWQTWKNYLEYLLALDALDSAHDDWWRLSGEQRRQSFAVGYAAFLAKYRFSLDFVTRAERNPFLDTVLNEPVPEIGLPPGTYAKLKFRFLNSGTATEYGAQAILFKTMRDDAPASLQTAMEADSTAILKMGQGQGELLTAKNALNVLKSAGGSAWFPVQTGVSEWMGDTKVHRTDHSLITPTQIEALHKKLLPGDVLLARREWFLSNIGLPGYWPHAALYIGTPEERKNYFSDSSVGAWIRKQGIASGDFEEWLRTRSTTNYAEGLKPHEHNHPSRVLEAMSEGVAFTTLEHCADADSLVVLRPKLPKVEKVAAIARAFHYAGRPYDFNFDFATDSELVCTELVYKSYEQAGEMRGLQLPLTEMLGRQLLPANLIAKQFDEQYGTPAEQFEFIAFLDGFERGNKAVASNVDEFRQSWRRPKWHVITQDAPK